MTIVSDHMNMPVTELLMSARAERIMSALGIVTVRDLTLVTPRQILRIKGAGQATLVEISSMLTNMGMTLSPNPPETRQDVTPLLLDILGRGHATSADMHATTGIRQNVITSTLWRLEKMGRVRRVGLVDGRTATKITLWAAK